MAARFGIRRKKRSGWKHPLNLNRNRRRCDKRRRSATATCRQALAALREAEMQLELQRSRQLFEVVERSRFDRHPACPAQEVAA